jgi:hypothetical protein
VELLRGDYISNDLISAHYELPNFQYSVCYSTTKWSKTIVVIFREEKDQTENEKEEFVVVDNVIFLDCIYKKVSIYMLSCKCIII